MTLAAETTKPRQQLMVTEPWPFNELSTRNCRHCLVSKDGAHIHCGKGRPMVKVSSRPKRRLTYNGVIRLAGLARTCQGCASFDNNWESSDEDKSKEAKRKSLTGLAMQTAGPGERELLASCPGCLTFETVWLKGKRLTKARRFSQNGQGMVYHDCGSPEPCRLFPRFPEDKTWAILKQG